MNNNDKMICMSGHTKKKVYEVFFSCNRLKYVYSSIVAVIYAE